MSKSIFLKHIFLFLTILSVFILSMSIGPYYINGDQVHYIRIYNGLEGLDFFEGYYFYQANIDSREPGYFTLAWASSNLGIDKNYFITFFNVFLAYFAYRYLNKIGGHPFIVFLIITFSYYSFVLFFAAERLKFGFVFLLLAFTYTKRNYLYLILSVITHAQMIIVITSAFGLRIKMDVFRLFNEFIITKKFLCFMIITTAVTVIVFIFMQEHLLSKFDSYFELRNIIELSKLFLLFFLSLFYAKNKKDVVVFFVPLFLFTLMFGSDRVNFIGYFAFLYFSIYFKRGFNLGVLVTGSYFLYTGFYFLLNIIKYGDGFYNV